jgi:hypothetical protein
MLNHKGGDTVKAGFYLDWRKMRFEMVETGTAALTGTEDTSYIRVPTLAMLVVAPIMGAMFVMFLPFIGFALIGEWAWTALRNTVRKPEKPAETKII